jgi:hypothetical protein
MAVSAKMQQVTKKAVIWYSCGTRTQVSPEQRLPELLHPKLLANFGLKDAFALQLPPKKCNCLQGSPNFERGATASYSDLRVNGPPDSASLRPKLLRRAKALRTKIMDEAIIYEWRKQQKLKLDFNKGGLGRSLEQIIRCSR